MKSFSELSNFYIVGLSLIGLSFDMSLIVTLTFIYKVHKYLSVHPFCDNTLALCSFLTMILSLIYMLIDWMRICYFQNNIQNHVWFLISSDIIYYVATLLLYISLILRIYSSFQDYIEYALSKL